MRKMWNFNTRHFSLAWYIEPDALNTDYMDADLAHECRQKVRSGEWECFISIVQVKHRATNKVLAETYLGNSIYADPAEFRDHFGMNGKGCGSYFTQMVREAIAEARKEFPEFQKKALNCSLKQHRQCVLA